MGHDAEVGRLSAGAHEEDHIGVLHALHDGHFLPEFLQSWGEGRVKLPEGLGPGV